MKSKRNLLVITDGFPQMGTNKHNCSFVKNYVDLVKDEFNQVFVISPQPYFPKFLSKIKFFKNFVRFSCFTNYSYQNVRVFYPSFLMLPIKKYRQKRGDYFVQKCEEIIQKNNLNFDLIHTHFLFPSAYAGIKLKEKYNKPIITTAHGSDTYKEPFLSKVNLRRTKNILSNVDLVTVPSTFMANTVKKINKKVNYTLVPNFVDTSVFKPSVNKQKKAKTILVVGNLIKSKGVLDIIPTVQNLLNIRKDFVIKIIGHGSLETFLRQQVEEKNLGKYIKLLGAKQNQTLLKYYQKADVLFFPSKAESFGIVQIEALACGVPVVAAPNEGSKFVLKNYCGYISKTFQSKEFAILLNKTLNRKWNKKRMQNYVIDNFSSQKGKMALQKIYNLLGT